MINMIKKSLLTSLLLGASLFGEQTPASVIDTGQKISSELLKKLSSKLQNEIRVNGLLSAVNFCHSNALVLTEEINLKQVEGLSVKRISLKERNPANIPSPDEAKVLESMQALLDKKELPEYIIEEGPKGYTYYKPLVIKKEACLKCHGDISKNPELSQFLKEHYPEDKATGYKMGDLRGAVVVEIRK